MTQVCRSWIVGLGFGVAVFAMAAPDVRAQSAAPADLDSMIKAAKAEGEVTFYSTATENVAKRIADGFTAKYGIKAQFLRMGSGPLLQRYSSEAQSGVFAADFMFNAGSSSVFIPDAVKKGWVEPIEDANLPVVKSGEYPAKYLRYGGALVQIAPWQVAYNTDNVKGADIPKSWKDLLAPRFKNRILLADPKSAGAYMDVWGLLEDTYGESFLTAVRDQNPRWFVDGVPAVQGLGAGEGDIEFPVVAAQARAIIDKGGPVAITVLAPTSGVEMFLTLTNPAKAKHPNAARLFANYVMTPEGGKVFNAEPGSYSVYDTTGMPKGYAPPNPAYLSRLDDVRKKLGVQ
jgi:iron(III) transport system substrate-binding protein